MEARKLGKSGLRVSALVLGAMPFGDQVDETTSFAILDRAFASGIFTFDTADFYPFPGRPGTQGNSERILGQWAKTRGIRHQVVLATKGPGRTGPSANERGGSRKHIMQAVEASLQRLGGDYIDLYQFGTDTETPIEETLRALEDLVRQGKVLYVGVSTSEAWWTAKALWKSEVLQLSGVHAAQLRYNLLDREAEAELLPLCGDQVPPQLTVIMPPPPGVAGGLAWVDAPGVWAPPRRAREPGN